ncbi:DUF1232 domain-containing protein [Pseudomethylobacillus aquaticus]|uniref:DUF1232 domain-containing protein n=1 Tax=Pseudomethylobacillus aquaticus TaxID=2676064 RepID=A0A3N0UUK1_9PROT|nr:DUF1232 domain-containing protein [Pseudomethylobacillus aquaticus]ROH84145.1 DUF1232 domain-containing protein [Pseudomethylobacillus aquaticus]
MKQALKQIAQQLKFELRVYQRVLKHPQTPWLARLLLWLAIGYVLLPFDLIPDFIPVIGQLDEVLIVPGLIYLALKLIPSQVIIICREQVKREQHDRI